MFSLYVMCPPEICVNIVFKHVRDAYVYVHHLSRGRISSNYVQTLLLYVNVFKYKW